MQTSTVFVRTTKAEREGARLSNNLMRVLMLVDGKSSAVELAERAPPSLRKTWGELFNELVTGRYIINSAETVAAQKNAQQESKPTQKKQETASTQSKAETDPEARQKAEKEARAAELKAYFAAAKEKAKLEAKQAAQEDALAHAKLAAATA
ncbi:MAG: hypothetical protein KJ899_11410, partial [Gammaproteobacteria bacterium]|nr:hypothetical protein [Gammaproteobacteria bacterium]